MAITRHEVSVTWDTGSFSDSVPADSGVTSDELTLDATCVQAQITLKADNSTTPASNDIIYFWLLQSAGDPDGDAAGDEYDTTAHALRLGHIDTSDEATGTGIMTVQLPLPQKGIKIYAEGDTAGSTNPVTVSAVVSEQRAS